MLRGANEDKQFTVRIEQKDIAIKYRDNGEKFWQDITSKHVHELDDWEMEKEWEGLEDTTEMKEYEAFTPGKEKRESEGIVNDERTFSERRELFKRKEITPPKGASPKNSNTNKK